MEYLIVFCAGVVCMGLVVPVIAAIAPWILLLLDFIDLTGAPQTPQWLSRLKERWHGKK